MVITQIMEPSEFIGRGLDMQHEFWQTPRARKWDAVLWAEFRRFTAIPRLQQLAWDHTPLPRRSTYLTPTGAQQCTLVGPHIIGVHTPVPAAMQGQPWAIVSVVAPPHVPFRVGRVECIHYGNMFFDSVFFDSELYQCSAMRYPLFPFMAPDREFEVRCAKEAHVITTLQTCAVLINTMTEGPLQHYMLTPKWREKYVVYRNGEVEFMIDMHWLYNYAARLELLQMAAAPPLLPLAQS
jgi:hypothetical protein